MTQHGPRIGDDGTTLYRVWAPRADRVEVETGGTATALPEAGRGWFAGEASGAHGDRYAFRLDGGPPRPDPASRWQPDGVHGHSALFDHRTVAWPSTEAGWRAAQLAGAVIYELHVGTFTPERTLDAAAGHLPRLAELGVTHVELMPVHAFNGTAGWGYDGVAWFAVHEPYGGPAAMARFVAAAHTAGLAVVVDAVYNHLGPSGNYLPDYGPYLTDRYRTAWGEGVNLDGPDSDPVRALILGSALAWFTDFHVDALRLDAVHGLVDQSSVHILTEMAVATAGCAEALRRPLQLIAESDRNDPRTVVPISEGGIGMDAQWADDLHHAIHVAVSGEQEGYYADYTGLEDVAAAYTRGFVFDGRYSVYRQRTVGAPLGDLPGHRLVTCVQNHDQVGNRALGDRLETLVGPALARVAAVLLCASPTTPMLFMGEEYGETRPFRYFTSHPEPELGAAVREGRREEFAAFSAFSGAEVPDPQDPATVASSTLDRARADTEEGRRRWALWRDLLALRRAHPALGVSRRDLVEVVEAGRERLVVRRGDAAGGAVLLAVNLGAGPAEVALPPSPSPWRLLLDSADPRYGGDGDPGSGGGHATGVDRPGPGYLRIAPASATLLGAAAPSQV